MHSTLVDFLNHGILPFVGRTVEAEHILSFWHSTIESGRLRVALLRGEAGIGKSRLIEETIPGIVRNGGTVVHTKLYPEATSSIAPMIARALHVLSTRLHLNIGEPCEEIPLVTAALRRLARLRPTLLIIEDIHLLHGETLRELAVLLEGLAEEAVSLLALARPAELPARGLLERYLVEEIDLRNLNNDDLAELWSALFGTPADTEMMDLLGRATLGNPLAIRSALRGSIRSGAIAYDPAANRWHQAHEAPIVLQTLERSVELLSEGMAAHLTAQERDDATTLAALGEVFSREAAHILHPGADSLLEALTFKGIITTSITNTSPLPGSPSAHPVLAFTHTLLHNHLLGRTPPDTGGLLKVIASGAPLYSILPFEILHRQSDHLAATAPIGKARDAITHALATARALDASPDWSLGMQLWSAAAAIASAFKDRWSTREHRLLQAELLSTHLTLLRRSTDHDAYETLVRELEILTSEPTPRYLLEHRLKAFSFLHALGRRRAPELCLDTWMRAQDFLHRHTELYLSAGCLAYMDSAARSMLYMGEQDTLRQIDELLTGLMESERATEEFRHQARQIIAFHCLDLFSTPDELDRRLHQMRELELHVDQGKRMTFLISKIVLLCSTGRMREVIETTDYAIPLFREQNLSNNFYFGLLARAQAMAALGKDPDEVESEIQRLCVTAPDDIRNFKLFARMTLIEIRLLRDDSGWLDECIESCHDAVPHLRPESQAILALEHALPWDVLKDTIEVATDTFLPLLELLMKPEPPGRAAAIHAIRKALDRPLLRINDLIEQHAILMMIQEIANRLDDDEFPGELRPEIHAGVSAALAWLGERGLPPFIFPFLSRYGTFLGKEETACWQARIRKLSGERLADEHHSPAPERIRVSMLGTVQIARRNGEIIPVRGSRLRVLLGLLVADRMLDAPLEHLEFSVIAAGNEGDPDRARKTLNGIVFRLREVLGHGAIDTGAETPRLNLELVEVDLLDAHTAIREADEAMQEGSLLRARERIAHALELTGGEVPFPNLYENFFEAAREDFENALRGTLIRVARRLLAEGDPAGAEELLRAGFTAMQEDEEIADLLREALTLLGKRVEAERIRIRLTIFPS